MRGASARGWGAWGWRGGHRPASFCRPGSCLCLVLGSLGASGSPGALRAPAPAVSRSTARGPALRVLPPTSSRGRRHFPAVCPGRARLHAAPSLQHAHQGTQTPPKSPWSGTKHGTGGWEHMHCQCVRFGCAWQPHRSPHIRGRPAPGRTSLPGHCSGPPAAAQVLGLRHPPGLRPPGLLLPFVLPPGPGVLVQCSPDAVPGLGHLAAAHPPQASPAGWPRGAGRSLLAAGAGRHVAHRRHGGSVHPRRTLVLPGPPEEGPRQRGWSAKPHA